VNVFFDIDTQIDFLFPAGALYVPGAEKIIGAIAELNRLAARQGIPVLSTVDAHTEDDPEFKLWKPHCVAGTTGQQKPATTLLEKRVVVPNVAGLLDVSGAQQILLEKQTVDCFSSVNLVPLLDHFGAQRCVVYGVVTEICVKNAIFGLLKTGRKVELVEDAVRELDPGAAAQMKAEFLAAGGRVTTLHAIS
jgi:nicotinamidase/pyrazinamidase